MASEEIISCTQRKDHVAQILLSVQSFYSLMEFNL